MGAMTVQNLYDYVRSDLDEDDVELPDALINVWLHDAINHIQQSFDPWHFYEDTWTLSTASASTPFSSLINAATHTVDTLIGINDVNYPLKFLPHQTAERQYAWGSNIARPVAFSVHADTLYLWPKPDTTYAYTIWGYRSPIEADSNTDTPDLPNIFHPLLAEWMCARAYERNDDDVMSAVKFNRVDMQLKLMKDSLKRAPQAGIQVMGKNKVTGQVPFDRLRFDWEF